MESKIKVGCAVNVAGMDPEASYVLVSHGEPVSEIDVINAGGHVVRRETVDTSRIHPLTVPPTVTADRVNLDDDDDDAPTSPFASDPHGFCSESLESQIKRSRNRCAFMLQAISDAASDAAHFYAPRFIALTVNATSPYTLKVRIEHVTAFRNGFVYTVGGEMYSVAQSEQEISDLITNAAHDRTLMFTRSIQRIAEALFPEAFGDDDAPAPAPAPATL
jgi:hypothetical protein